MCFGVSMRGVDALTLCRGGGFSVVAVRGRGGCSGPRVDREAEEGGDRGGFELYAWVVYCGRVNHLQGQRLLCGSV